MTISGIAGKGVEQALRTLSQTVTEYRKQEREAEEEPRKEVEADEQ